MSQETTELKSTPLLEEHRRLGARLVPFARSLMPVQVAGIRAQQATDAMAVIYTGSMAVLLVIALRFVNPTQLVTRLKEPT